MFDVITAIIVGFSATWIAFVMGYRYGVKKSEQARIRRLNALRKMLNGKI